MSLIEEEHPQVKPMAIFGEITREDMQKNALLAKVVMKRVKEVCEHSKGRYSVQQVADGFAAGVCSIWGVMEPPADLVAIMVTAPNEGVLDVLLAGPDIKDVTPFLPRLDGIARANKCAKVRMMGPGFWKTHLDGWKPAVTVYERDLAPTH